MSNNSVQPAKKRGLKVFHKGLILVSAPLIIEIVLITSLAFLLAQSDKESVREARFRRCAAYSAKLISLANEAVTTSFGAYHGDSRIFIRIYDQDMENIKDRSARLTQAAKGDGRSEKAAQQLIDSLDDLSPLLDKVIEPARQGKRILEITGTMKNLQSEFAARRDINMERMASVTKLQDRVAEDARKRVEELESMQFQILSIGVCVNVIAGILLMLFYRSSILLRLKVVMGNTLRLAQRMELSPQLKGIDEISRLDGAFHMMDRDLKKAAERERSLFENVSDVICVLDKNLEFVKVNPACQKSWGYTPEELLNQAVDLIIVAAKKEETRKLFEQAFQKNEQSDLEITVLKKEAKDLRSPSSTLTGLETVPSPEERTVETLWSTYYSESEDTLYCVVHDITERKQIERARQSFITMMSSDLRQPLFKIIENISTLLGPLSTELSQKAQTRLESAKTNSARLLSLVNDLLQLTQSELDSLESHKQDCDVKGLLQRSAQDLEGLAQKSKIEFAIDCSASTCYADPNKIMQVIVNLGSNAIKFSPAGSIVTLKARTDGDFVKFEVIDKGRGVPESHKSSVFEKFQQVDAADGKLKAGTGLGLPICKEMIEQSSGEIGLESEEGKGSIFWFSLPVSEEVFVRVHKEKLQAREDEKRTLAERKSAASTSLLLPTKTIGTNMSLFQKGLLLIGVPIVFELVFVCGLSALLIQTEKSRVEESHQRQIAQAAYRMLESYFTNSLNIGHTRNFETWLEFDQINEEILQSGIQLQSLIKNDASAKSLFAPASKLHEGMVERIKRGRQLVRNLGFDHAKKAKALPDRFVMWAAAASISKRLGKLIDEAERKEFINPKKQIQLRRVQGLLLCLGLFGNVLLSIFLARFFSKDITTRLAVQADNAGRLARDIPLNPVFPGSDEIAKLDRAFHDTAEKLAEARRKERAILDNSRDLICVLDHDAKFLSSNPAGEEIFSCNRDELLTRSLLELISPEDQESASQLLKEDLSSGDFRELRLVSNDGRNIYVMLSLTRPPGQDNIFCIAHDISHRKELEQLKQDFLAMVSHDLRSPLTSMTGTAALIEEGGTGPIGETAKLRVHDIIVQGEQLIELINDLLDLEKLEAGKMQLILSKNSCADYLEKACEITQSRFNQVQIDLGEALDEQILEAEFDRLVQALSSILSFLAARSEPGKVIKVEAEKTARQIRWTIVDAGPSLTVEEKQKLFEREFAAKLIGKLQTVHLSILGLPLAKKIIEAHNGKIRVQSKPNSEGNKVVIDFPCDPKV